MPCGSAKWKTAEVSQRAQPSTHRFLLLHLPPFSIALMIPMQLFLILRHHERETHLRPDLSHGNTTLSAAHPPSLLLSTRCSPSSLFVCLLSSLSSLVLVLFLCSSCLVSFQQAARFEHSHALALFIHSSASSLFSVCLRPRTDVDLASRMTGSLLSCGDAIIFCHLQSSL